MRSDDKIKVLHVVDVPNANPWLNGLADHHDRRHFEHLVVSLGARNEMHMALEQRAVRTFALDARSRWLLPQAVTRLASLLRREEVSVVQTHLFDPSTVGLLAAKLARTPLAILMRHHADFTTLFHKPVHRQIDRLHAWIADRVWAPSGFIRRCMVELEHVPSEKITVTPHGFDFSLMRPRLSEGERRALREEVGGDDHYLLGVVARLSVEKGHEFLFRALPKVLRSHARARVVLIGSGPRRGEMERLAAELGIAHAVRFLGWRSDVWNLIEAMDLIAHPSLHEPFGQVYVESMALERVVVTTGDSAAPEILDHQETGIIVPPRDPQALAAAIIELMDHPERVGRMGREARRRAVERFGFPKIIREYEHWYHSWLGRN